jgi:hypothetical protein
MNNNSHTESSGKEYSFGDVLLKFTQPNMLIFPEMLVSAVVSGGTHSDENDWGSKFVFQWDAHADRKDDVKVLFPAESEQMEPWIEAVGSYFDLESGDIGALSVALAHELEGIKAKTSPRIAAVPVTIAAALLQSRFGVTGSLNAENYSAILHQTFQAGTKAGYDGNTCGGLLIEALRHSLQSDRLLNALELSVRRGILTRIDPQVPIQAGVSVGEPKKLEDWVGPPWLSKETPYSWFNDAWVKLTRQDWVEVLPPRRWVDWVATVARLGMGMSVLWQARYLDEIGELILNNSDDLTVESFVQKVSYGPLIHWEDSTQKLRQRNVQPAIRSLIARGAYVDEFLESRFKSSEIGKDDKFSDAIQKLRTQDLRQILRNELDRGSQPNPKKRRRDAVESCLTSRSLLGQYADQYGFLVQHGKGKSMFRIVDPSTEVLALIASLSCGTPSGECSVGDVRRSLRHLGFQPSIPELVRRLERAGLCRDSADASDSVRVKSAFRSFE